MNNITLEMAAEILSSCGDAYILIHRNPDGDCIGAGYALKEYFNQTSRKAKVVCSDVIPDKYSYLKNNDDNDDFEPEIIISVDTAEAVLFGESLSEFADEIKLSIDHHAVSKPFAKNTYTDETASSACEIIYYIFECLNFNLTETAAAALYTGIASDTGSFQFSNTKAATHSAVSKIMTVQPEVDYAAISRKLFVAKSMAKMKLESLVTSSMESYFGGKCRIVFLTEDMIKESGADPDNDTDGMANIPLIPEGTLIGITIREIQPGRYKVSVRSAGEANAARICSEFGGGGHIKAAGCKIDGTKNHVRRVIAQEARKELRLL